MKKLLLILLLVFAANVVEAQTSTTPKIHLWVDEGLSDYTIPNELWTKLGDSRIFNKLGTIGYTNKFENLEVGDYILKTSFIFIDENSTTTSMILLRFKDKESLELIYMANAAYTIVDYPKHREQSIDVFYKQILEWHDEYLK